MLLKAVRLALMSVTSVGGSRTRGAGECRITVKGFEKETPGPLFREIVAASDIAGVDINLIAQNTGLSIDEINTL